VGSSAGGGLHRCSGSSVYLRADRPASSAGARLHYLLGWSFWLLSERKPWPKSAKILSSNPWPKPLIPRSQNTSKRLASFSGLTNRMGPSFWESGRQLRRLS
jgi:hypothetical protein